MTLQRTLFLLTSLSTSLLLSACLQSTEPPKKDSPLDPKLTTDNPLVPTEEIPNENPNAGNSQANPPENKAPEAAPEPKAETPIAINPDVPPQTENSGEGGTPTPAEPAPVPPEEPAPQVPAVSFAEVQEKFFALRCLGCHKTATERNGFISLATYDDVKKNLVLIRSTVFEGIPQPMPRRGLLKAEQTEILKQWLDADAPL